MLSSERFNRGYLIKALHIGLLFCASRWLGRIRQRSSLTSLLCLLKLTPVAVGTTLNFFLKSLYSHSFLTNFWRCAYSQKTSAKMPNNIYFFCFISVRKRVSWSMGQVCLGSNVMWTSKIFRGVIWRGIKVHFLWFKILLNKSFSKSRYVSDLIDKGFSDVHALVGIAHSYVCIIFLHVRLLRAKLSSKMNTLLIWI